MKLIERTGLPDDLLEPGFISSASAKVGNTYYYGTVICFGSVSNYLGQVFVSSANLLFRRKEHSDLNWGTWNVL